MTPEENRDAEAILEHANAEREERDHPPFATISQLLEAEVGEIIIPRWSRRVSNLRKEKQKFDSRYSKASEDIRDQIQVLLGPEE